MKKVSLSGSSRENVGKKDAKALRAAGQIPAVLYGGDKQVSFSVSAIAFDKIYYSPDVYQIELDIDGTVTNCIIKDLQAHPVSDKILHIDMYELSDDKEVVVSLPVRSTGSSVGILNGGALINNFRKVKVKGLPGNLPEEIVVDITPLNIGDMIRIGEVEIEGCTIVQNPSAVILAVKRTRVAVIEEEVVAEEGAEGAESTEGGEAPAAK